MEREVAVSIGGQGRDCLGECILNMYEKYVWIIKAKGDVHLLLLLCQQFLWT